MYPILDLIKSHCRVFPLEEHLLTSPEALLCCSGGVLTPKKHPTSLRSPLLQATPTWSVILPSNPLHHLLMAELSFPVVATSGNLSDEPICTDAQEALKRLGNIADRFLVHNRPIARHVDDSVARVVLGRELVLRRARGYAPLFVSLSHKTAPVLAVGAHLKNSAALSVGDEVFISQHIGDLETSQAFEALRRVTADFEHLYEVSTAKVACDLHPDYLSTRLAEARGRPVTQ